MQQQPIDNARWRKAASELRARFSTDYRNNQMLHDPWSRAAHCMAQSWRNIASQGRLGHIPETGRRNTTWKEAAHHMKGLLNARRSQRLLDTTTWSFWANHLPRVNLRYIRKARRTSLAHRAQ
jgi:hypothetical protein